MFGSAWGVWQTHAHDDIDDDDYDDDDNHDHHYHNHLSVSLVGRRASSAHVPADDYRFIARGGHNLCDSCRFGANRNRVAMGQQSQGSGLSGNVVHVTASLFKTLMSESSFGNVYSHMRRDPRDS